MKRLGDIVQPSGLRSVSIREHQMRQKCLAFDGLAKKQTKSTLLALAKQAGPALGISEQSLYLLDQLMSFSRECDWESGRKPVVWPSNERLCESLCIGKRALQYRLRALRDAGLIVATDAAQERRRGRRGPDGHIIQAVGFDLSPLAVRAEEFRSAVRALEEARRERRSLRRRRTIARKAINILCASAIEAGLDEEQWRKIAIASEACVASGRGASDNASLKTVVERLESIRLDSESLFQADVQRLVSESNAHVDKHNRTQNISPERAKSCTPTTTTKELRLNKLNTVVAREKKAKEPRSDPAYDRNSGSNLAHDSLAKYKISPELVACTSSFFKQFLPKTREPNWLDVADAGSKLRRLVGISDQAWSDSVSLLGAEHSAVLIALVIGKRNEIRSAGGYFRGMVRKARIGELNVGPSLHALRDRSNRKAESASASEKK